MPSKISKFESLLEAVPDALVGMDQKGLIRFVNRQTESLFGYDRDELIGRRIETLVPEDLWPIYVQHKDHFFADLRTRSSSLELVLTGRRHDGGDFPVNISISHIDTGDVLLVLTAVRDVKAQRQAVEAAQLTAALVEYSEDAIVGSTLQGVITSWNPAARKMYGYSGEEIIGRSGSVLFPHDRLDEMKMVLARIRAGQAIERLETTRVRKDGSVFPASLTIAPIRNEDAVIVGASAVHRDVTGQREAFELAQRMTAIVESSDDAIIGRTLDGIITSWNPAAERMFGYSRQEILGKSVGLMIPSDRAEEMETILAGIIRGQPVEHLETIRARKDGTILPISLTVSPIRGAEGAIVGASVICRDLTEQERAAQYARSLIEAALDPMVTISPAGRIDDVNEATIRVTGVAREELIGSDYAQYVTAPDKAAMLFQRVFQQGSVADFPLTVRHRDGTLTDVRCNASVYRDMSGDVLGVFAAARDVTGQRQAFAASQHYSAILAYSEDAIISGSPDGLVTSWNPAAERMYGYSSEEIIGQPASILTPGDRAGEIETVLDEIRTGRPVERCETTRVRKDGVELPVSLTVSPIFDADGAVVGTFVIHRELPGPR